VAAGGGVCCASHHSLFHYLSAQINLFTSLRKFALEKAFIVGRLALAVARWSRTTKYIYLSVCHTLALCQNDAS